MKCDMVGQLIRDSKMFKTSSGYLKTGNHLLDGVWKSTQLREKTFSESAETDVHSQGSEWGFGVISVPTQRQ